MCKNGRTGSPITIKKALMMKTIRSLGFSEEQSAVLI